jgi:hypothetical protein
MELANVPLMLTHTGMVTVAVFPKGPPINSEHLVLIFICFPLYQVRDISVVNFRK